ncbi:RraA family protein [Billgrantia antri]|uniref:Putative 4-hydroxy-4-methyl-2-oxoglutarate aldolase n=1 Tax=Billgrantia antri TaxID=2846777 RepID=A0ABS6ZRX3_9GAMM|nr:RraA family protein [Halomonas antri]MBW6392177.1 RraA family protein [Halomonas antri]
MFDINPRTTAASPELLARYRDVATSTLGHLTDFGAIVGLTPLRHPVRLLGRALTVRIPHLDGSVIRRALEMAEPGEVLVIDVSGDERRACWGELRSYAALRKGLAGVVTSGRVTDAAELAQLNLPVYSRGTSPLTTRAVNLEGEVNVPVAIDGVAISPGDLIIGDDDGLFALSPARAEALLVPALDKQAREAERRRELMAAHPEWWR